MGRAAAGTAGLEFRGMTTTLFSWAITAGGIRHRAHATSITAPLFILYLLF